MYVKFSKSHTLCRLMFCVVGFDSTQVHGESLCDLSFEHYDKIYNLITRASKHVYLIYKT